MCAWNKSVPRNRHLPQMGNGSCPRQTWKGACVALSRERGGRQLLPQFLPSPRYRATNTTPRARTHTTLTHCCTRLLSARGKGRGTFRQASEMKHCRQWGEKRSLETPVFLLTKQKSHRRRDSVSHCYRGLCSCAPAPIPVLQEACCLVL